MSSSTDHDDLTAANDDLSAVDHLLAAYEQTKDPFGKYLIGLALVHEGQVLAKTIPQHIAALTASRR